MTSIISISFRLQIGTIVGIKHKVDLCKDKKNNTLNEKK